MAKAKRHSRSLRDFWQTAFDLLAFPLFGIQAILDMIDDREEFVLQF